MSARDEVLARIRRANATAARDPAAAPDRPPWPNVPGPDASRSALSRATPFLPKASWSTAEPLTDLLRTSDASS